MAIPPVLSTKLNTFARRIIEFNRFICALLVKLKICISSIRNSIFTISKIHFLCHRCKIHRSQCSPILSPHISDTHHEHSKNHGNVPTHCGESRSVHSRFNLGPFSVHSRVTEIKISKFFHDILCFLCYYSIFGCVFAL